jgi:hypothetical protein
LTDKEKAIISDGLSSLAPPFLERCNYNAMIELARFGLGEGGDFHHKC